MARHGRYLVTALVFSVAGTALAQQPASPPTSTRPDPASIQKFGPGFRYPQAGWIMLHVEGEPYERGYQYGYLLAPEIAEYVKLLATYRSQKAPADAWRDLRLMVNALFLRKYDPEYLQEMKGIADGAAKAGATFDGRLIDFEDVVTINSGIEIDFLSRAIEVTPNGLEGLRFNEPLYAKPLSMPPAHCSAFAATGPATADGKVVFGHITMWNLYHVRHFNVWIDIQPTKGHRLQMQTFPGGIMSGMDYYLNSAGILCCETTISQTGFDVNGASLVSRIRRAMQYADTIDKVVEILGTQNNGLYSNEWLLADVKTNEIAMYELGTKQSRLWRSSKGEWLGGTEGFYWGCNNTKDLQVRLETMASVQGRPANVAFRPSDRDIRWIELYNANKGKIGASFGFQAFTTPPLAAFPSCDAKFTTTELAKQFSTYAVFGPPLGRTWDPTPDELRRLPDIKPLVSNDWTLLQPLSGPAFDKPREVALDLAPPWSRKDEAETKLPGEPRPAWHGTILPARDADIFLTAAFAEYERMAALENAMRASSKEGRLSAVDQRRLDVGMFGVRSRLRMARQRLGKEFSPDHTKMEWTNNDWFDVAASKGVLFLHALRQRLGTEKFDRMMDEFGRENAGKPVSVAMFRDHVEKVQDASLRDLLVHYYHGTEEQTERSEAGLRSDLTQQQAVIKRNQKGIWSIDGFGKEPDKTLIVFGTLKEANAQREAAAILQRRISRRFGNFTPTIKADKDVTKEEMANNHLLLIGRPDTNQVAGACAEAWPVAFGPASFTFQDKPYANSGSALICVGTNPATPRYSVVLFAGLSAAATWHCVNDGPLDRGQNLACEVILLPQGSGPQRHAVHFQDAYLAAESRKKAATPSSGNN